MQRFYSINPLLSISDVLRDISVSAGSDGQAVARLRGGLADR
jgi:hypothetical protein